MDDGPASFWPHVFSGSIPGAAVTTHELWMVMYTFHRFKRLPAEKQLEQLSQHGVPLDLWYCIHGAEAVLFAYHNFYVELVVEKYTDEILSVNCFRSTRKLTPYLLQIDISEITPLLACSK